MIRTHLLSPIAAVLASLLLTASPARGEVAPDPARGLYAIWSRPEISDPLPFLRGDQVRLQWRDVQPSADRYDFRTLDTQLARVAKLGRLTTVQLNANRHPDFLTDVVPSYKGALKRGETDRLLQYWHPAYVQVYTDLIAAFARAVKSSPYRESVIGVRLNYNAIGTEFLIIRPEERERAQWAAPTGVALAADWTEEISADYRRQIVATFLRQFNPEVRVLLRTGNPLYAGPDPDIPRLFGAGNVGVFTTASEIEPRLPTWFQGDRPIFLDYCRSGATVGYAESMADATGKHGPAQDPRWCPPAQYNYWRLLSDLNLGFSMIGVYGSDLARADEPEFRAAFEFADRYAGYHASPSQAPGAWVALREGGLRFKGDYSFLMHRLPGSELKAETNVGPADQRFGAWAATLPAGKSAHFVIDADLARSLEGNPVMVRVIYLDRGKGRFWVARLGDRFQRTLADTGRWKTLNCGLDPIIRAGAPISVVTEGDLTLHMIEVARIR
jgi:hypothetical protein